MVKHKLIMVGLLAGLGLVGFVAVPLLVSEPSGPGVTRANYERITDGMTRHEVEVILGGLPKSEHKGPGWARLIW